MKLLIYFFYFSYINICEYISKMIYKKSHGLVWLVKSVWEHTLIYKLYSLLRCMVAYFSDMSYISETLYSKEFSMVLRRYLHTEFSKDWIGRLYGIVNPIIDINGNLDLSGTVIEIDGNATNNIEYLKNWIYRQMQLIDNLFKISKLYDYITVDISHVGPINADNYLVVFDVASRKEMMLWLKSTLIHTILYILIAVVVIFILL